MHSIQETITTGKEVDQSSDDPIQFYRANRFRQGIKQNEQYLKNIQNADSWLKSSSFNLESMLSRVMNLRERAIQGANDSFSADDRLQMASGIDNILEDLVNIANESFLDKNIFSGTKTKIDDPFRFDGNSVSYHGNTGKISRRISENLKININVTGQDLLDTDMFNAALSLRTSLINDDTNEISQIIGTIDSVSEKLISLNTGIGTIQQQLELAKNRLDTANMNLTSFLSDTEDVDLAKAITQYNSEEMAYQAALQSTAKILRLNIMDFLK
tara:strand:+ start:11702 stop:12517 length:816 start_codon:yes stop_codon:yes gene_type:complete